MSASHAAAGDCSREAPRPRTAYPVLRPIQTRWADNDAYGHVNNVAYYGWFDTVVNAWLIEQRVLDVQGGDIAGFVVETGCRYFVPLAFPQPVDIGLRVAHSGRSSVRYELGVFAQGAETPAAQGHFVHVYVDRASGRPVPLPDALRRVLVELAG